MHVYSDDDDDGFDDEDVLKFATFPEKSTPNSQNQAKPSVPLEAKTFVYRSTAVRGDRRDKRLPRKKGREKERGG